MAGPKTRQAPEPEPKPAATWSAGPSESVETTEQAGRSPLDARLDRVLAAGGIPPAEALGRPGLNHVTSARLQIAHVRKLQRRLGNAGVQQVMLQRKAAGGALPPPTSRSNGSQPTPGLQQKAGRHRNQNGAHGRRRGEGQPSAAALRSALPGMALNSPGPNGGGRHDPDPQEVQSQLGAGQALPAQTRTRMEQALGQRFDDVRLHTGPTAERLAGGLAARAFTVGQDVAFAPGQYRPGTLAGDALIAHELAHVAQQRAAAAGVMPKSDASSSALEEDADWSALGAVSRFWRGAQGAAGRLAADAKPALKTGLRLQRCTSVELPAEAMAEPTLDAKTAELMERLDGLEHMYLSARGLKSIQSSLAMARSLRSSARDPAAAESSIAHLEEREKALQEEVAEDLPETEFADADEFLKATQQFETFFFRYLLQTTFQMLRDNEKIVRDEAKRYELEGTKPGTGISDLKAGLEKSRPKLEAARRARNRAASLIGGGRAASPEEYKEASELQEQSVKLQDEARGALQVQYPILADPSIDLVVLLDADPERIKSTLKETVAGRLEDIADTRKGLAENPEQVWSLEGPLAVARQSLAIYEGSIFDLIIKDKAKGVKAKETFKKVAIGALAIVAGLLTFGKGAIAVLGLAGSLGVGIYSASESYKEYMFKQAARGTAFDRARAVSAEEPSLFWLALDIVGVVTDLFGATRIFKALRGPTNALLAAKAENVAAKSAELTDAAKAVARAEGAANPEAFAKQVVDDAMRGRRHADILADPAKAADLAYINSKVPNLDPATQVGLLRMSKRARVTLLTRFKGKPDLLRTVAHMAEGSDETVRALNNLRRGLGAEKFEIVVEHYMRMRTPEARNLIRAIGQAGVTESDIRAILGTMSRVRTAGGVIRKFRKGIHETIARRAGPGAEGIKKILDITADINPSQAGAIFEHWAAQNVFGRPAQRFSSATSKLPGKYKGARITTDDVVPGPRGGMSIVDYKHLRTAQPFSGHQLDQLENYAEMIRQGAKHANGKPFTHVEYVFSTREAAAMNASAIRLRLGSNATIKYIDEATGAILTYP